MRHYWYFGDKGTRSDTRRQLNSDDAEIVDEYRRVLRLQHKSYRTEKSYVAWVRRFLTDVGPMRREDIGPDHVRHFLSFNALLFLCRYVLHVEIDGLATTIRSRRPKRLPVVLRQSEVQRILGALAGSYRLMARIMYGSGLRLEECLSLRIRDVDFETPAITVRAGKGDKDRVTMLPQTAHDDLHQPPLRGPEVVRFRQGSA